MSASMNGHDLNGHQWDDPDEETPPPTGPREIDLSTLWTYEPAKPRMLLPTLGTLPEGEVTLLAADGGTGKSNASLYLAVCVALGIPFFGEHCERRRVGFVSFEDSSQVLHWRLSRACWALQTPMRELVGHLRLFDGTESPGTWYGPSGYGRNDFTQDFHNIRAQVEGCEVLVVDGSSDVFGGNENDRSQVKSFIRGLRTLVPDDGALLLIAHVDKNSAKEGKNGAGYSGSTGWNNGVRSRLHMYREREEDDDGQGEENGNIIVAVKKSNYGKTGSTVTLTYDEQYDVLRRVDSPAASGTPDRKTRPGPLRDADERSSVVTIIREAESAGMPISTGTRGENSSLSLMSARPAFPDRFKTRRGVKAFYQLLNQLEADGKIRRGSLKKPNRHVVEVWSAAFNDVR